MKIKNNKIYSIRIFNFQNIPNFKKAYKISQKTFLLFLENRAWGFSYVTPTLEISTPST